MYFINGETSKSLKKLLGLRRINMKPTHFIIVFTALAITSTLLLIYFKLEEFAVIAFAFFIFLTILAADMHRRTKNKVEEEIEQKILEEKKIQLAGKEVIFSKYFSIYKQQYGMTSQNDTEQAMLEMNQFLIENPNAPFYQDFGRSDITFHIRCDLGYVSLNINIK